MTPDLEQAIAQGVEVLRRGGLVAYPTDTVYGLGADPFNLSAVERVFEAKGRPEGMALPLLLGEVEQLEQVVAEVPPSAWVLIRRFWPGALTLVLPRAPQVPALVTARGWTVAVRLPDHPIPRALARGLGRPITGTSANLHGAPPARTADEVRRQLGSRVDWVLEGGPPPQGRPSTIVDLTGPRPRLLREGAVPPSALQEALKGDLTLSEGATGDP